MYVHTHTHPHTHTPTHTHTHKRTHSHTLTHTHTHTHPHPPTHPPTHPQTHTHTQIQISSKKFARHLLKKYLRRSYKAINNLFRDSHTQIPHHVATSRLNFDKIQITGFRKTRDKTARNLRTGSNNKSKQK